MGQTGIRINFQTVRAQAPEMHGEHRRSADTSPEAQRNAVKQVESALKERLKAGLKLNTSLKIVVPQTDKSLPKVIKALDAKILHSENPLPPLERRARNLIGHVLARPPQPLLLRVLRTQDRLRIVHRPLPDHAVVGEAVDV
jgi:hypothetical protein